MSTKRLSLSDCCDIVSGATPSTSVEEFWNGDISWATPKDISALDGHYLSNTPRKLTNAGLESCAATMLPVNSVLLSSRAPIGLVAVNTVPMATNQGFKSFVPRTNLLESKYLFHWLRWNRPYLESLGNGATFKELSKATISRVKIPLPPLDEQRKIAAILDQADSLRVKRRETVKRLSGFMHSSFVEMFGDPLEGRCNEKIVRLIDISTRITDGTHLTPKFLEEGVPFIFVRNFNDGFIDFATDKFISEGEHKSLYARCPVEQGDILYTTVGATYGQAAVVGEFTKFAFQRHVAHIKPDASKVLPGYLGAVMQLPFVKRQADQWARGAAQPTVNLTELRQFKIPLPSQDKQQKFSAQLQVVDELRKSQRAAVTKLDKLFLSLQDNIFRGIS